MLPIRYHVTGPVNNNVTFGMQLLSVCWTIYNTMAITKNLFKKNLSYLYNIKIKRFYTDRKTRL